MTTTNNSTDSKQGEALKPCPFCGGPATMTTGRSAAIDAREFYNPGCDSCDYVFQVGFFNIEDAVKAWNSRASLAAVGGDAEAVRRARDWLKTYEAEKYYEGIQGMFKYVAQLIGDLLAVVPAAVLSPLPAEPPPSDAKFIPPAEDALHIAICQAVQEHHGPSANAILRTALNDYKPTQLTRTELIRIQQRSGADEVTAVMVSPAEPRQEGEQEFGDLLTAAVNAIKAMPEDRRSTGLAMLHRYFTPEVNR